MQTITTPAGIYTPPATALIQKVQLRIFESCPSATLRLMQYDRVLPVIAVELFEGGNPYKVPENAAVNIRMVKPDKTTVYNPALGVSSDRKTTYIGITPQMTACFGSCTATLEIALNDGVLGTGLLRLNIEKNPVSEDAVESSDEYLSLQEIVNKVQTYADQAAEAAETAEAAAESAMNSAQSDLAENNETEASYVKNRTHWKKHIIDAGTVLAETSVAFTASLASVSGMGTNNVKVDGNYVVKWNGTAYDCTAYDMDGSVCLGNAALFGLGGADTGEPFAIEMISATGASVTKNTETAETITLAVEGVETDEYHQLDPRFIPDMYYTEGGKMEIPVTGSWSETDPGMWQYIITAPFGLEVGKTYTVNWNGTDHIVTAKDVIAPDGSGMHYIGIGNEGLLGGPDTGEPFWIMEVTAEYAEQMGGIYGIAAAIDASGNIPFTIYGSGETIHKLDNKYLDLEWLPVQKKTLLVTETVVEDGKYLGELSYKMCPVGKSLLVAVDGVKYSVTVKVIGSGTEEMLYIGNLAVGTSSLVGTEFDTGEPFNAAILSSGAKFNFADDAAHRVAVYAAEANKMPAEFLPEPVIVDGSAMTLVTGEDLTISLADAFGAAAFAEVIEQLRNGVRVGLTISFQPKTSAGTGDVSAYTMMFSGSTYNGRLQWSGTYIDGSAVHEINVQVDPGTGMLYAMAREVTGSGSGSGSLPEGFDPLAVVSTKAQSFTPEQQAQARSNIGAESKEEAADTYRLAVSAGEKAVAAENAAAAAKSAAETAATAADEARTEAGEAAQGAAEAKATANQAAEDAAAAKSSAAAAEDSAASALAVANQKAPEKHAASTDKYGLGSRGEYGHVLIQDTIADEETTGAAASPEGVARAIAAAKQEVLQEVLDTQQADWNQNDAAAANYVKNRTHWVEDGGEVELTNKPSLTLYEQQDGKIIGTYIFNGEYVEGETYVVYWNGVRYECVARYWPGSETQICLGNLDKKYGSGDTGEPFYLTQNYGSSTVMIYAYDGTTQLALKVNAFEKTYHKLPEEYLPESVDGVVIRSSTEGSTKKFRLTVDDSGIITATEV